METVILSLQEISLIRSFVQEMFNIPMVECVYLVSYLDDNTKQEKINVITIQNQSLYYNKKLTGKETMRNTMTEYNNLKMLLKKFQKRLENSRLSFILEDDSIYSLTLMHYREIVAEKSLVNGTILFDRFGDKEKNKQRASCMLPLYSNRLQIENIEQIINYDKDFLVLKKIK